MLIEIRMAGAELRVPLRSASAPAQGTGRQAVCARSKLVAILVFCPQLASKACRSKIHPARIELATFSVLG